MNERQKLLLISWAMIGVLAFFCGYQVHGQSDGLTFQDPVEPAPVLKCLKYNDGRLAIINVSCTGQYETISWFLSKGYHIDAVTDGEYSNDELYMSR